eukprot:366535-Chlamydomonas_euryale.AAC.4
MEREGEGGWDVDGCDQDDQKCRPGAWSRVTVERMVGWSVGWSAVGPSLGERLGNLCCCLAWPVRRRAGQKAGAWHATFALACAHMLSTFRPCSHLLSSASTSTPTITPASLPRQPARRPPDQPPLDLGARRVRDAGLRLGMKRPQQCANGHERPRGGTCGDGGVRTLANLNCKFHSAPCLLPALKTFLPLPLLIPSSSPPHPCASEPVSTASQMGSQIGRQCALRARWGHK